MKKHKASALILLLLFQTLLLLVYTPLAIQHEGIDFVRIAAAHIASFTWSGQFSLDFLCYLVLSALWILWRNQYKLPGIVAALAALAAGILFFAPYLIYLIYQEEGDLSKILIGRHRSVPAISFPKKNEKIAVFFIRFSRLVCQSPTNKIIRIYGRHYATDRFQPVRTA